LDSRQVEEILLTAAQSLFAVVVIASFTFSLNEALILLALFISQLFFVAPEIRYLYSIAYLGLAVAFAVWIRETRVSILSSLPRKVRRYLPRRPRAVERRQPPRKAVG